MSGTRARWRATSGLVAGAAVSVGLLAAGLVLSRPDVAVLGLPPLVATAVSVARRPRPGSETTVRVERAPAADGRLGAVVTVDAPDGADAVRLRLVAGGVVRADALLPADAARAAVDVRPLHSGPAEVVAAAARPQAGDTAFVADPTGTTTLVVPVAPAARTLDVLPVPRRLTGIGGDHEGARPGSGGEFRDIHAYVPGDDLRRVDWKATARLARRPGELFVRRTNTLSDAVVSIVVDTVDDLGEAVVTWGSGDPERSGATSLDLARDAASAVASAAIRAGDRVAYAELVIGGRAVRSGGGSRHLARVRAAISRTCAVESARAYRRTPPVAPGSEVVLLSTFLDAEASRIAVEWRAAGHRVIAVDVLPPADLARLSRPSRVAHRIVLLERDDRIASMTAAGVETVRWAEDGDRRLAALVRSRR